jgi:hypothetical protein
MGNAFTETLTEQSTLVLTHTHNDQSPLVLKLEAGSLPNCKISQVAMLRQVLQQATHVWSHDVHLSS